MKKELNTIRQQLDTVDRTLLEALAARHRIVEEVAALKTMSTRQIRDFQREGEILERLGEQAEAIGLDHYYVTSLYQRILDYSVRFQTDHLVDAQNPSRAREQIVVAYHGSKGAYSHLAAEHHFSSRDADIVCHGYSSFREAMEAVEVGDADYALLPIENTTAGSINETYDLLGQTPLSLVGEEVLKVKHCLVALEKVPLRLIRRISAHPQAIAQCSVFLSSLKDCHVESYFDSAQSARRIREEKDLSHAAIASEEAAEAYGLHVLKQQIANHKENYTRYVIIARDPITYDTRIPCKTSLIFTTKHEKGALIQCLNVLQLHDLSMTKLESRPRSNTPWEYRFYVDIEGNQADPEVQQALEELAAVTGSLKVLGSYPARLVGQEAGPVE